MAQDEKKNKPKALEIAAVLIALIGALATLIGVLFGQGAFKDLLFKTPTPQIDPLELDESKIAKPGEKIVFLEDFQDGQQSFYGLEGNWSIQEDPLQLGNKLFQVDTTGTTSISRAILIQSAPQSYTIVLKVRFTQGNLTDRDFVSLTWREDLNFVIYPSQGRVYSRNRDTGEAIFDHEFPFVANKWYTLKAEINENNASFYLDDQKVGNIDPINSTAIPEGLSFVVGEGSNIVQFDDLYVTSPAQ